MTAFFPDGAEESRQNTLLQYAILDTLAETAYDDLTRIAGYIAKAPTALITFIDRDRQWFKSRIGFPFAETPRNLSFCAHAILEPTKLFIVPDALADARFVENPFVTSEPTIRFYCGAPLVTPDRHAIGTLCVIDYVPRVLDEAQRSALEALSRQVVVLLELRRATHSLFYGTDSRRPEAGLEAGRARMPSHEPMRPL